MIQKEKLWQSSAWRTNPLLLCRDHRQVFYIFHKIRLHLAHSLCQHADFIILVNGGQLIRGVSGKGVPAALFMVIGKTLIKEHTQPGRDLGEVFTKVNDLLCESNSEGLFITAFEGVLDLVSGGDIRHDNRQMALVHHEEIIEITADFLCRVEYIENLTMVTAEKERIGAELSIATQIQADMLPGILGRIRICKTLGFVRDGKNRQQDLPIQKHAIHKHQITGRLLIFMTR